MRRRKKTAILISGRGSNMSALLRAAQENNYPAQIVTIVSDNPAAAGLQAAKSAGLHAVAIPREDYANRKAHEAAINNVLAQQGVELICLGGYMRLLSADFTERWAGRIINIHPSLLPLFPGLNTHDRALEAGMRIHGCTVHFVTPKMDQGPIIAQAAVPIVPGDDAESLARRTLHAEHRLYPLALALVASNRVRMEGETAVYTNKGAAQIAWGEQAMLSVPSSIEENHDLEQLARLTP